MGGGSRCRALHYASEFDVDTLHSAYVRRPVCGIARAATGCSSAQACARPPKDSLGLGLEQPRPARLHHAMLMPNNYSLRGSRLRGMHHCKEAAAKGYIYIVLCGGDVNAAPAHTAEARCLILSGCSQHICACRQTKRKETLVTTMACRHLMKDPLRGQVRTVPNQLRLIRIVMLLFVSSTGNTRNLIPTHICAHGSPKKHPELPTDATLPFKELKRSKKWQLNRLGSNCASCNTCARHAWRCHVLVVICLNALLHLQRYPERWFRSDIIYTGMCSFCALNVSVHAHASGVHSIHVPCLGKAC